MKTSQVKWENEGTEACGSARREIAQSQPEGGGE